MVLASLKWSVLLPSVVLVALFAVAAGQPAMLLQDEQPQQNDDRAATVKRGKYLTHHVAMCIQCHTPRDENGQLDQQRLFKGARIPLKSPFPNQVWAAFAPHIAGLPGRSEADLIKLLETGRDSRGNSPRPPMPPFRMQREDAAAVAAYLSSLEL